MNKFDFIYSTRFWALALGAAYLATPPTVTKGRMMLKNGNIQEWISFSGVSGNTITGLTRDLSQTADPATGGTGLDWAAGTQIILVAMHDQLPDKNETTASAGTQNWKVWVFKAAVS